MKLFLAYLFACFFIGVFLSKTTLKARAWILIGVCVFVLIGYYFLNQI